MIAVIERDAKVVWGVGPNNSDAMADAKKEIAGKPHFKVGKLEFAPLLDDAPLELDGTALFKYVQMSSKNTKEQMMLF